MTTDASNTAVAVSGEIFVGAETADTPTGFTFSPAENGYTGLGFLSSDGFEIAPEMSVSDLVGWQNAATLRSLVTDAKITASFKMVETKAGVVETFWATTVDSATGGYDVNPAATGGRKKWIFQIIDGDEIQLATYVGEINGREPIMNQSGEAIGYGLTLTFYPSTDFGGKTGRVFDSRLVDDSSSSSSS